MGGSAVSLLNRLSKLKNEDRKVLIMSGMSAVFAGLCGALGLVGLFCCATNSPFASIALSIVMFGSANLHLFALVCVICFVLSGHSGLYSSQIIQFPKAK